MEEILKILLIFVLNTLVKSFPSGAPVKHCGDMTPGHNVEPLSDPAPFYLAVTPVDSSNLNVQILANSNVHFKGFLLEARSNVNALEALGMWTTQKRHTKLLDCFNLPNSAVTHYFRDNDFSNIQDGPHFTQLNFNWNYANLTDLKQITFVATIVKKFKQIYKNVTLSVKLSDMIQSDSRKYHFGQLMIKLKQMFVNNLRVEYVHFSFLFMFIIFLLVSLLLMHVLSIRRARRNRYFLLGKSNNCNNNDNNLLID